MLGISSPLLAAVPGVSHRFFQRIGGTSPHPWSSLNTSFDVRDAPARVEENLARVRFQIGVPREALYACTQVHGVHVERIEGDEDPVEVRARTADGLVTRAADVAVAVRTADCAPILLAVDDGSAVAALHAGWRGAVGGILAEGVRVLCAAAGVGPERLVAAVGPTIGFDAFEVGPEVTEAARTALSSAGADLGGLVRPGRADPAGERQHLDLGGLCLRLLAASGVERFERVGDCTVTREDLYFSHRRDVTLKKGAETGRQMSAIARTAPPDLDDEAFR
jgi:polyphenol oxidase